MARALRGLRECESAGFTGLEVLRDLAQHVEMLMAVRESLGAHPQPGAVYQLTRAVWPRCVAAARQAGHFEPRTLARVLVRLTEMERAAKTGRGDASGGLEVLFLEWLSARATGAPRAARV
jgi:DNA polymerase III delta subunit